MGRIQELVAMLGQGRVGFRLRETMKGTHTFLRDFPPGKVSAGTELPFAFDVSWGHDRLTSYLRPGGEFMRATMKGTVTAGGLCLEAPLSGTLELRYLQDATIRYVFEFEAHGQVMTYQGEKRDIRPWNLHRTHTTCYGRVTQRDVGPLSESVVHFDLGRLPGLLASFRLT